MTSTIDHSPTTAPVPGAPGAALRLVVIGARDSGATELAEHLSDSTPCVVHVGGAPSFRPHVCIVAIEAAYPIRPDDLDIAVRCARSTPVAVVLTGCELIADWQDSAAVTAARLRAANLGEPVAWEPSSDTAGGTARGTALVDAINRVATRLPAAAPANPRIAELATADWLQVKRTETVSARSTALRRHTHAARLVVSAAITSGLRPIAIDGKMALLAQPRRELPGVVDSLCARADATAQHIVTLTCIRSTQLRQRHLAEAADVDMPAAPRLDFALTHPPRHMREEVVLLAMGAAGGTGVGRLIATPFAHSWPVLIPIIALTLLGGCVLGLASVRARRTAALRHHLIGMLTEQCAALRSDLDHLVGSVLADAEAAISDAFAHDPGPRAHDLDHRIRQLRDPDPHQPKDE